MKKKIIIGLIVIIVLVVLGIFVFKSKEIIGGYTKTELTFKNEQDQGIYAMLYKPNKKGKVPLVIYSHGLGATYRACGDYADHLAKEGIASVCIDFRGGSNRSKSDGKSTEMSIITEMDDVETVLKEVKKWEFVDTDNIILMGSSQGGAVSALISAKHEEIKGAVLLYPATSLPSAIKRWYSNTKDIPEEIPMNSNITVGKNYFTDVWDLDVYKEIANDEHPIIMIHGTEDPLVNPSESDKLHEIYKNSKVYKIEGAGHGFDDEYFDEAIKYVDEFFKEIGVLKE